LPPGFDNLTMCVKWKRRDGELATRPACAGYTRSGPHHSAKYEAKHFLLYASVYGDPEIDLGKHMVDLTRLLPLTLEELEDKKSSGKWTTTYWLSAGSVLYVKSLDLLDIDILKFDFLDAPSPESL
nr:protein plastid movement impaired 1-related 1-like [Tanacetum cinerariifolium]